MDRKNLKHIIEESLKQAINELTDDANSSINDNYGLARKSASNRDARWPSVERKFSLNDANIECEISEESIDEILANSPTLEKLIMPYLLKTNNRKYLVMSEPSYSKMADFNYKMKQRKERDRDDWENDLKKGTYYHPSAKERYNNKTKKSH